jgi:cytochrome c biogenesis factor
LTQFGELTLWIALLMAAWSATLAVQGAVMRRHALVESAARGLQMALLFGVLAAGVLMRAFLDGDYSLRYVAMHSGVSVASLYKICAFWSGRAGLLLLASVALAGTGLAGARGAMRRDGDAARAAWTLALLAATTGAVLAVTAFTGSAFALFRQAPTDGRGLDPLFRHPFAAIQPLLMVAGVAAAALPLALLGATAIRRRLDEELSSRVRAAATVSWALLSLALLLGAQWAYLSPGLRVRSQGTVIVLATAGAWAVMTLVLAGAEVRARAAQPPAFRRRVARLLAGCGAALCAVALAVSPRTKNYDAQIDDGSRYAATDSWGHAWTFTSQGESRIERPGDDVIALVLLPTRDGVRQPFLSSESRQYFGAGGLDIYSPQIVPAVQRGLMQDLFVVLADAEGGRSVVRISFRPLVELAWAGGVLLVFAGALFFWPLSMEAAP